MATHQVGEEDFEMLNLSDEMFGCVMEVIVPDDSINNVDSVIAAEDSLEMSDDGIDSAGDRESCPVSHQITQDDCSSGDLSDKDHTYMKAYPEDQAAEDWTAEDGTAGEADSQSDSDASSIIQPVNAPKKRNRGSFSKESKENSRTPKQEQERKRKFVYRKKTQIAKQLKSLELATGWTGMFILKSPDDKSVIHGATDSPMEMNFQHGKPIIDIAFLNQDKKCNKKINMSKIVSKLSKQKRQAQSFVPESPLPSPEKLPDCLRDLAGRQRNTLSDVSLSVLNFSDCSHEIASPVIKRKQGQKKSQL